MESKKSEKGATLVGIHRIPPVEGPSRLQRAMLYASLIAINCLEKTSTKYKIPSWVTNLAVPETRVPIATKRGKNKVADRSTTTVKWSDFGSREE